MNNMSERDLDRIAQNDVEWRKLLWKKMEQNEKQILELIVITTTLKVKVGVFGIVFGSIGGAAVTLIAAVIK